MVKNADGNVIPHVGEPIFKAHKDAYAERCHMAALD
jgi:hypothetical protein